MRPATGAFVLWLGLAPAATAQPAPPPALAAPGPRVDAPGRLPGPPASLPDQVYDSRLRESAAAAERFQGPLDGSWVLSLEPRRGGRDLYAFELADRRDQVEGAWRDLGRPRDPAASGVMESVARTPRGLVMRFDSAVLRLGPDLRGRLQRGDAVFRVSMRRPGGR